MINRDYSADLIKSISIIGVVFIHGATLFGENSNFVLHTSNIFRFCVPCFIILWAYYFEKSCVKKNEDQRREYTIKRFIHLFKVFIFWSLLYFFINANWEELTFKKVLTSYFLGFGWSGQYYFIILLQLLVLHPLIRKLYLIKIIRFIIILSCAFMYMTWGYFSDIIPDNILKISDRPFIYWVPYVFVGIGLAKNEIKTVKLYFALSVIFIAIELSYLEIFKIKHSSYLNPSVILGSILFFLSIFKNEFIEKKRILEKTIHYIGSKTLTVFVANPLVIFILKFLIPAYIFEITKQLGIFFSPLLSTFIILLFCLLIAESIKKIKLNGHLN
jgi:fucose 4-O-acetylase-like acetyltransferase